MPRLGWLLRVGLHLACIVSLFVVGANAFAGVSNADLAKRWGSQAAPSITPSGSGRYDVVPGGPSLMSDLISHRQYAPGPTSGHVLLRDLLQKPMRTPMGERAVDLVVDRWATRKAIAAAAARALPVVGTALWIKDIAEAAGCEISLTQIIVCQGSYHEEPNTDYRYVVSGWQGVSPWFSSPAEAVNWLAVRSQTNSCNLGGTSARCKFRPEMGGFPGFGTGAVSSASWGGLQQYDVEQWEARQGVYGYYGYPNPPAVVISITRDDSGGMESKCDFELQPDGSCKMVPTPDEFGDKAESNGVPSDKMQKGAEGADRARFPYDTTIPDVSGPGSIPGGRTSEQTNPDGSRTTNDRTYDLTYSPPNSPVPYIDVKPRDSTTTWPPNTTPTPYEPPTVDPQNPGNPSQPPTYPPGTTTTTTITNNTTNIDVETCGLPHTPPCKIDESGTDTTAPDITTAGQGIDGGSSDRIGDITGQAQNQVGPAWTWTFQLPTGCSPIPTPGFARFGMASIDVCQFQPQIHAVMAMLWCLTAVWACIGMVSRALNQG